MKLCRLISYTTLALGLACALSTNAQAAIVYDKIIVRDASGTVFASTMTMAADIGADPDAVFYVAGIAVDLSQIGSYGMVVDTQGNALEIFGIGYGGPDGYDLSFGGAGAAAAYFPQYQVADTGEPIDLTMYLDPDLQHAGDTATLLAVATPNSVVPEPLTWAMMAVGFAVIGRGMRRAASLRTPASAP